MKASTNEKGYIYSRIEFQNFADYFFYVLILFVW